MTASQSSKSALIEGVFILLATLSLTYMSFFHTEAPEEPSGFLHLNEFLHPLIAISLSLIVTLFSIFSVLNFNRKFKIIDSNSSSIAVAFLFFLSLVPEFFIHAEKAIALFLTILMLRVILDVYNQTQVLREVFLASLLLSFSSLFYPPTALFILVIWVAIAIFRAFELKNYILSLMGFVLPYIYLFGLAYLFEWELSKIQFSQDISLPLNDGSELNMAVWIFALLVVLVSFGYILLNRSKMVVRSRNHINLLFLFMGIALLLFSVESYRAEAIALLAVPLSLFYAALHRGFPKKWIIESILLLALLTNLWVQFIGNFFL